MSFSPSAEGHHLGGQANEAAAKAAVDAGASVRSLTGLDEIAAACAVFAQVWETEQDSMLPVGMLRALEHAGNYAAGAFDGDRLVGAGVGFYGNHDHSLHLHSHIVGVLADVQSRSVGFAVKQHQRAWAVERGLKEVQWTFDPLVRRNGWFNVSKLGARVAAYYPDFYGKMNDGINAGEPSDRGLVVWDLSADAAVAASERRLKPADHDALLATGAHVALAEGGDGRPVASASSAETVLCFVPRDIVAMRAADPALARSWRLALRDVFVAATDSGLAVTGMTRSGCYVFTRPV
jgi:predicted GNAT superfamily acetyltransferase